MKNPQTHLDSNTVQLDPKLATPISEGPDPKLTPDPDPNPTPDLNPNPTPDPELAQTPLHVMFFHHGHFVELPGENAITSDLLPQHQFRHFCLNNKGVLHFHIAGFPEAPLESLPIETPSTLHRHKPWDPVLF